MKSKSLTVLIALLSPVTLALVSLSAMADIQPGDSLLRLQLGSILTTTSSFDIYSDNAAILIPQGGSPYRPHCLLFLKKSFVPRQVFAGQPKTIPVGFVLNVTDVVLRFEKVEREEGMAYFAPIDIGIDSTYFEKMTCQTMPRGTEFQDEMKWGEFQKVIADRFRVDLPE